MIQRPYESGQCCDMWRMSKCASVPNLDQIGQRGIFTYLGPGRATGPGCTQEGGSGGPMSLGSGATCGECQNVPVFQIWAKSDKKFFFTYLGPGRAIGPGCPQEGGSGGPMSPGSGAICGECQDVAVYQIWAKSDKNIFSPLGT